MTCEASGYQSDVTNDNESDDNDDYDPAQGVHP